VLTLRGLILFLGGKLPQALQHVQSALRLDPGHEPAQKLRKRVKEVEKLKEDGNAAFKLGRLQEAVDKYTEALAVSRDFFFVGNKRHALLMAGPVA
jgi:DnaJ family protein C protein 7